MDDAFVAHVDRELAGLDRVLHAQFDESTVPGGAGLASRVWFYLRQFRLGIAVTVALCLFLWML
jgi:hypothetical protein